MSVRVLFVDDDPFLLQAQRRVLFRVKEWKCTFCENGETAIAEMKSALKTGAPFDVLISDMRMPKMSGAELCCKIRELHPKCVRIMLSGQTENGTLCRIFGPSHQYLQKPCPPDELQRAVARSRSLVDYLERDDAMATVQSLSLERICESRLAVVRACRGSSVTSVSLVEQIASDLNWLTTLEFLTGRYMTHANGKAEMSDDLFADVELADLRTLAAAACVLAHLREEFSPSEDVVEEVVEAGLAAAFDVDSALSETAGWEVAQWVAKRTAEQTMLGCLLHSVSSFLPFNHILRPECLSAALLAQLGLPHSIVAFVAARRSVFPAA